MILNCWSLNSRCILSIAFLPFSPHYCFDIFYIYFVYPLTDYGYRYFTTLSFNLLTIFVCGWFPKRCGLYTHPPPEHYSDKKKKKNEIIAFAAAWMDLEIIVLREVRQLLLNVKIKTTTKVTLSASITFLIIYHTSPDL